MDRVPCFLLERTDRSRITLRKYTFATRGPCPDADGGHEASVVLGNARTELDYDGQQMAPSLSMYLDDPRWPDRCAFCQQPFPARHEWEVLAARIYRVSKAIEGAALPVGEDTLLEDAPIGAMWRPVLERHAHLTIRAGVNGHLKRDLTLTGHGWSITGDLPRVTVSQMLILDKQYGAFLREGVLERVGRC